FYSGGLFDPSALKVLWQTYANWVQKGTSDDGEGHGKEWWYWLQLLARYELPALLGLIGAVRFAWPAHIRFLNSPRTNRPFGFAKPVPGAGKPPGKQAITASANAPALIWTARTGTGHYFCRTLP